MQEMDESPLMSDVDKQFLAAPVKSAVDKFQLLPEFLKVRGLVKQHLDSFNYFVRTEIKKIVRANDLITSRVDPTIYLRYKDVWIGEPSMTIDGVTEKLSPHKCRLSDITYAAPIYVNIEYITGSHGQKTPPVAKNNVIIGRMPIMLRSCCCVLHGKDGAELARLGECPLDPGGYFIIKGTEKVILIQEQLSKNRIIIDTDKKGCVQASVMSSTEATKSKTVIKMEKEKIYLYLNQFANKVPIMVVMKAMGMESDQEVVQMLGRDPRFGALLLPSIEECASNDVYTQHQALEFLEKKVRKSPFSNSSFEKEGKALGILRDVFIANIPVRQNNFRAKCIYVAVMLRRMMEAILNKDAMDDKDYVGNKRLELSGQLLSLLFEDLFKTMNDEVKKTVDATLAKPSRSSRFDFSQFIVKDSITVGLERTLSTGNWDVKRFKMHRKGMTQVVARLSFIGTLGHMTKISPQFEKSRKVSGPRALQPSQWGMLCPCDTPEGEACGLVKNLALMTHVTTDEEEGPIVSLCYCLGVEDLELLSGEELHTPDSFLIILNGIILGKHRRPQRFANAMRKLRRAGKIGEFVSVFVNEKQHCVYIASDGGRVCRPLVIADKGVSRIKEHHMKELLDGVRCFDDFLREGLIEYLDVNEENNALIALYEGEATFETTHIEIEPFTILGVCAGLIPFPHHNQSPRNTYQCAMGKQAMGNIAYNQLCRMDTLIYLLVYPQRPLLTTRTIELVGYDKLGAGQNATVAVMSYSGYDIEDAIVMNKASLDRGFGRCIVMKKLSAINQKYENNSSDRIIRPQREGHDAERMQILDDDGLAAPGEIIRPNAKSDSNYAVITNRKECWQGLEQDITGKVSPGSTYTVSARVGVSGPLQSFVDVLATLKLEYRDSATSYLFIGRTSVSKGQWEKLEGTFSLSTLPDRIIFYLEGPSAGIDLLIDSVVISCTNTSESGGTSTGCFTGDENIILNPRFEDGLNNWSGRGCKIVLHDSMGDGKIMPMSGKFFASARERTQSWNGIQQEITARVQRKLAYEITAIARIFGNNVTSADLRATLWVQTPDLREQYIGIANLQATDKDWVQLQGKFLLNASPSRVVIYLEGPPPGTDILLNSLVVKHADKVPPSPPPDFENVAYGVNILTNGNLHDGTNSWFPLGSCTLSVGTGSPHILPPMARDSLGPQEPLSGRYILVTNRTQTWMGPAQMITDNLKLSLTYQVSAWVRIGSTTSAPQNVNVALSVDNQWVNGGQVELNDDRWHEIGGSFRIEKQPNKVMVYVQGPAPGVDLMVGGFQIFPVDRQARFRHLRRQTDKIRKRDVVLKFSGADSSSLLGTFVKVKQTQNSFPFGSCVSRTNIDNEDFVDFFAKNFNWAVFGNELKWYWTEPQQGNFNYRDADELLNLCVSHNIETRGHCIFWEVESTVQSWIRALNKNDMMTAVQNRLTGLLTRYKGKFKHYDVNNEMLHGSFYQDHLGKDIRANMFKTANQLDSSAILFVNDYHVEDGCDTRSSPEKYIQHILDLQEQGAPVGGIGIQGHIDSPVGPIVCSALDKLGILGLPIWFTELDVSSINEHIRADDLEVMLREAFAHPAVDGVMLWGFWELFMSRDHAQLVNAEGDINEAGKRYLDLKDEWLSRAHGHVDEQGQFEFRGFQGTYEVQVVTALKKVSKTFVVNEGESPVVISINL